MLKYIYCFFVFILTILVFFSCPDPNTSTTTTNGNLFYAVSKTNNLSSNGVSIFHIETDGNVELTYTLDLGTFTKDVYFIFTNATNDNSLSTPTILQNINDLKVMNNLSSYDVNKNGYIHRDKPEITSFNENPFAHVSKKNANFLKSIISSRTNKNLSKPLFNVVGDQTLFYTDKPTEIVTATCRKIVQSGGKGLRIWVANDCWGDSGYKTHLTQSMVDDLANKFLNATDDNIYRWVTNIYGEEWGEHNNSELIQNSNTIDILLYDIDNDSSNDGGVLGFFYAKDNFLKTSYDFSNERVMFYIDAVMYGAKEGISWEISDKWPMQCISTLAHEFQHMIHFYQKGVLRAKKNSDTYLNEMCSMITEDFVADKLQNDGPRGVSYNIGNSGSPNNTNGRIPFFNYYNSVSVTDWGNGEVSNESYLKSYSVNYSFGSYLARNYGGVELFKKIVQSDKVDFNAISGAVNEMGYTNENFLTLLQKWGVSVILSDIISGVPIGYRYNIGDYFQSTLNNITYNLGSIDFYNYRYDGVLSLTGPFFNRTNDVGKEQGLAKSLKNSNLYYLLGKNLTGKINKKIKIEKNIKLTVVVR